MGDWQRELTEGLRTLMGADNLIPLKTFDATVVSVDKKSRTCVVNSEKNNIDDLTVRLSPEVNDGDINYPEIESTVIVAFTTITDPYIISTSWLAEKTIIVGDQGVSITPDGQVFNDGAFGGLVKIQELIDNLNSIKNYVESLKSATQAALGTVDASAGSVSQTPFITAMASKTIQIKDMENKSITHGEKLPE